MTDVLMVEGKHLRLLKRGHWEFVERTNAVKAVVVVAVTKEKELLVVEQFRPPVGCPVLELPAGLVGDIEGEDPHDFEAAARRELVEETGYMPSDLEVLTQGPVSPGLSNEFIVLVRARGLEKVGEGGGIENEEIIVHRVPLREVASWVEKQLKAGKMVDPKLYAGLYFTRSD
jgi:ADP-ribose diphosphatase